MLCTSNLSIVSLHGNASKVGWSRWEESAGPPLSNCTSNGTLRGLGRHHPLVQI